MEAEIDLNGQWWAQTAVGGLLVQEGLVWKRGQVAPWKRFFLPGLLVLRGKPGCLPVIAKVSGKDAQEAIHVALLTAREGADPVAQTWVTIITKDRKPYRALMPNDAAACYVDPRMLDPVMKNTPWEEAETRLDAEGLGSWLAERMRAGLCQPGHIPLVIPTLPYQTPEPGDLFGRTEPWPIRASAATQGMATEMSTQAAVARAKEVVTAEELATVPTLQPLEPGALPQVKADEGFALALSPSPSDKPVKAKGKPKGKRAPAQLSLFDEPS